MKPFFKFISLIFYYRNMIWVMAKRDMQSRYVGTLAGFVWTILQPLSMMLVYWIVFSWGLKVQPVGGAAFIEVFVCGMTPWLLFSEIIDSSSRCITSNPNLVKKILFPTELLPVISVASSLIGHGILLGILAVILSMHQNWMTVHAVQFFYLSIGLCMLGLGLGWLVASINVFYRDIGQIVSVILNMWFWLTPIVWPADMIPESYKIFFKINPIYYVVEGYKCAFIYHTWIIKDIPYTLYFCLVSGLLFVLGAQVFRKLKYDFSDVL